MVTKGFFKGVRRVKSLWATYKVAPTVFAIAMGGWLGC